MQRRVKATSAARWLEALTTTNMETDQSALVAVDCERLRPAA